MSPNAIALTALALAVAAGALAIIMIIAFIVLSRAPEASPAPAVHPSPADRAPWTSSDDDTLAIFAEPRPLSSLEDER